MNQKNSIVALPQTKLEKLLSTILPKNYGVNYNPRLPDDDKLVQEYWVLVALLIHTDTYSAFVDVSSKLEKLPVSNTSQNNIYVYDVLDSLKEKGFTLKNGCAKTNFPLNEVLEVVKDKSFAPILARLAGRLKKADKDYETNYILGKASIFLAIATEDISWLKDTSTCILSPDYRHGFNDILVFISKIVPSSNKL